MFLVAASLALVVSEVVAVQDADIDYGMIACCRKLLISTEEFYQCANYLSLIPNCTDFLSKCLYNNKWYEHGETISVKPGKCLREFCEDPNRQSDQSSPLKRRSTHPSMPYVTREVIESRGNCCVTDSGLFPEGYKLVDIDSKRCSRKVCEEEQWRQETSDNCIIRSGKMYFPGEVMGVKRTPKGCRKKWNNNGTVKHEDIQCCCIKNDISYECGEQISSKAVNGMRATCVDGNIIYKKILECEVDGKTFSNGEVVKPDAGKCRQLVCSEGMVVEEVSYQCCRDLENNFYLPGDTMEDDPYKCILKLCGVNGSVIDRSLQEACGCCKMGDRLFEEDHEVNISSCVSLTCRVNEWEVTIFEEICDACYSFGDPHFDTFDGFEYSFYGLCNYTLLQKGSGHTPVPAIHVHLAPCGDMFASDAGCVGPMTVVHNEHVVVTVNNIGEVMVNGEMVELPLFTPDNLVIWDDGDNIYLITFDGFLVVYTKDYEVPAITVYAPTGEKGTGWDGVCGRYDGDAKNDHRGRYGNATSVADHVLSWKTGSGEGKSECKERHALTTLCADEQERKKFQKMCEDVLILIPGYCTTKVSLETCTEDMCGCKEERERHCFRTIEKRILVDCDLTYLGCKEPEYEKELAEEQTWMKYQW